MSFCWIGGGSGGGGGGDKWEGDFRFIVRSSTPFIRNFWVSKFFVELFVDLMKLLNSGMIKKYTNISYLVFVKNVINVAMLRKGNLFIASAFISIINLCYRSIFISPN